MWGCWGPGCGALTLAGGGPRKSNKPTLMARGPQDCAGSQMLRRKAHIPYSIYRAQPLMYIGAGVLTLICLPNILGILSGLLLIGAGTLVIVWRSRKTTKRRKRQPAPRRRHRTGRTADTAYTLDRRGSGKMSAPIPTSEQNGFPTTGNHPLEGQPGHPGPDRIDHVDDGAPVTATLLSLFSPFNELNEGLNESFARELVVSRKPAGSVLIERGSKDDVSICLMEGTLVLQAADGRQTRVAGGTPAARLPLCQLNPHLYSAIAATEVAVIILSQGLLRDVTAVVSKYKNMPGIQVSHLLGT